MRSALYLCLLIICPGSFAQQIPDLKRFVQPIKPAQSAKEIYLNRNVSPDDYATQVKLIDELFIEGDYTRALQRCESLLKLDSTLDHPLIIAAESCRLMNDFQKASYYSGQIRRFHPILAAPYLIDALLAYQSNNLQEMLRQLQEAEKREPKSSYLHHYYTLYFFEKGELNKAKQSAKRMLKYSTDQLAEAFKINALLDMSKPPVNWKKAHQFLKLAVDLGFKENLCIPLAYSAYHIKEYETCLNYLDEFHKEPLAYAGPLALQAMAQFQLNQPEKAARSIQIADSLLHTVQDLNLRIVGLKELYKEVKEMPIAEARPYLFLWAQTMYFDHEVQYPLARRSLHDKSYCDKSKWFLLTAANHPRKKGRHALLHLQWAYKCDTLSPFLNLYVMTIFSQNEDHESAHHFLKKSIENGLNYSEAYYLNALYYKEFGDTTETLANFKKAIKMNPHLGIIWYEYGEYLLSLGDSSTGIEALEKCLSFNPTSSKPFRLISQALFKQSAFNKSLAAIDDAIRREPLPEDFLLRAKLRDTLGFKANIEEDLIKAHELDPENVDILGYYIRWLNLQQRQPEALQMMTRHCFQVLQWNELLRVCEKSDSTLQYLEQFALSCGLPDSLSEQMAEFYLQKENLLEAGLWFSRGKKQNSDFKAALCYINAGAIIKARSITDFASTHNQKMQWLRNVIELKEKGPELVDQLNWKLELTPMDPISEQLLKKLIGQLGLNTQLTEIINPLR